MAAARSRVAPLFTGDGKGKTGAALGVTMRAWGRGWRVCWLRFIKPRASNYGETRAAARMGIGTIPLGDGSVRLPRDLERDRALARERRERARGKIGSAACDLAVLDEIACPVSCGWLGAAEVTAALRDRPPDVHAVLTGRGTAPELVACADLVTEMREVEHPFRDGVKAQPGSTSDRQPSACSTRTARSTTEAGCSATPRRILLA